MNSAAGILFSGHDMRYGRRRRDLLVSARPAGLGLEPGSRGHVCRSVSSERHVAPPPPNRPGSAAAGATPGGMTPSNLWREPAVERPVSLDAAIR